MRGIARMCADWSFTTWAWDGYHWEWPWLLKSPFCLSKQLDYTHTTFVYSSLLHAYAHSMIMIFGIPCVDYILYMHVSHNRVHNKLTTTVNWLCIMCSDIINMNSNSIYNLLWQWVLQMVQLVRFNVKPICYNI